MPGIAVHYIRKPAGERFPAGFPMIQGFVYRRIKIDKNHGTLYTGDAKAQKSGGRKGTVTIKAVGDPPGKGVRLMWKRKLLKALLTAIFAVITAILLTTKAC